MLNAILISAVLLFIAVLLLGIRIFFVKNGKFPNTHIGGSEAMRDKGVGCATSQDRQARQKKKRLDKSDIIKEIIENN